MDAKPESEAERLSEVVLDSLDDEGAAPELARRAFRSRAHFHRLFRALIEESPGAVD
jgi:AraC family transcriptional regulator